MKRVLTLSWVPTGAATGGLAMKWSVEVVPEPADLPDCHFDRSARARAAANDRPERSVVPQPSSR